ncbi:MAG: gamma-glutamyl-gamma-aminobutyrate hydrolase family protein [Clostridia bacterium]|nr:gamma-glutamyl-gamma-aminobutyrate hydrolase family protein [Clostridia bacterium]
MKPIIGIVTDIDNNLVTAVPDAYNHAIEQAGGTPIVLPYVRDEKTLAHFVALCDGFLFSGGADIDPRRYGEEVKETCGGIEPYRDEMEFLLFQKALNASKPILAICRGIQLVNAALGGTLYQDIPSEVHTEIAHRQTEPKFSPSHEVNVLADTPLHGLVHTDRIRANSFHHQAIKTLANGLKVMATADDGIIEAVWAPDHRYLRAYQWHPERLFEIDESNRKIFKDFIGACRKHQPNNE